MPIDPDALLTLRIRTPRVELRLPTDVDVEELLAVAKRGIHPPEEQPFSTPWTDAPEPELSTGFREYHRNNRATLGTTDWKAGFVVAARDRGGVIIGSQGIFIEENQLPVTGSWLGLEYQGLGYGVETRAAVLWLLFEELGCTRVESGAFLWNQKSLGVSKKLGYVEVGRETRAPRGIPQESVRLELDRAAYLANRPAIPVEVTGLDAARDAFPLGRGLTR